MIMTPRLRKFMLTLHLATSVGWIGAAIVYLALAVAAMRSTDVQTLRTVWIAMNLSGWFAIIPLSIIALLTGLVMSLGTKWGVLQHYWVVFSLVLTVFANVILVIHMQGVSTMARIATAMDKRNISTLRAGLWGELLHAGVGLLVLIVVQVLNVYKPRGLTLYGLRKQQMPRGTDGTR